MPNKDSFTFSDKLKKSKSLPLSKRIPSKVGGDGKAKRTLIQRAQRDLPFIIVAAAALLLLPILSRNSGTDDQGAETPMDFVAPESSASDSGGLGQEIAPSSGFKNPLDYIVSRSGKDMDGTKDSIDAGDEDSSYEATTPPYTSEKGGEERATEKYAPAAKGAIRNALVRKATQISALRNSKTMAAGASTGVSRSLATGSAATAGGGASGPRVGTRPVALQPMTSAGKGGRSETGEGLYAEAARSLGAMNKAGSKQALFDSQLKNVDGTPLGSIGGGPNFGSGAGKLGAGGAPSNNVGYKPYLPWWWDFEKQKAMKHWELWNYNFQKALSDNIIKVGTSLALCLTTANADGKVDKFFGDPGGADDYTCPGGNVQDWETHRDLMGKDESGSGDSKETKAKGDFDAWVKLCNDSNGNKGYQKTSSSKKNMLDVRLRCLGLKYKNTGLYKWLQKANYSEKYNCTGVSAASGIIKFQLDSTKANKAEKMGHYVVAKDMANKTEPQVIYIARGGRLNGVSLQARIKDLNAIKKGDFVVTKVVGFTLNGANDKMATDRVSSIQAQINDLKSYDTDEQNALRKTKTQKKADGTKDEVEVSSYSSKLAALNKELEEAKKNSSRSDGVSDSAFQSILARIEADIQKGEYKSEGYVEEQFSLTVQKTCSIGTSFYSTKFSNLNHTLRGSANDPITCGEPFKYVKVKDPRDFSATIAKPGACTYAVVVEKSPITKDKYVVKHVVDFQSDYNNAHVTVNDDGSKTFKFDIVVGMDESATISGDVAEKSNGNGWVIWVTNNSCDGVSVGPDSELPDPDPSKVINSFSAGGERHSVCQYRWACGTGGCVPEADKKPEGLYCAKMDEASSKYELYEASNKIAGNKLIRTSETKVDSATALEFLKQKATVQSNKLLVGWSKGNDSGCYNCGAEAYANDGGACQDICYMEASRKVFESKGQDSTGKEVGSIEDIKKLYPDVKENSPLCPTCNPIVTQAPTPEKCTVTISGEFDPASYKLNAKLMTDIKAQAKKFYGNCVKNLNSESKVDIYVQGFTSYSGEVKDLNAKNVCAIGDTECESNQAKNLGARNILLSEDRAVSVGAEFIKQLKVNMSADKGLDRKVSMSALFFESKDAKRDAPSDTFNIKPRTGNQITDLINSSFYTIAENATLYGQDPTVTSNSKAPLTLVFNVYGYGAMGASEKETGSDRFVRVSTERSFERIKN